MMDENPPQPVTVAEVARVGVDLPCITCGSPSVFMSHLFLLDYLVDQTTV